MIDLKSQKPSAAGMNDAMREASVGSLGALMIRLGATAEGLTLSEAAERLQRYGPNRVAHESAPSWYLQLYRSFRNPFVLLLLVLAVV